MNSPTSSLGPRGCGPAGGGWPEEAKRWPAHNFRVRGSSCVHGEWRHCATSGRGAPGMGGERYAAATLWGPASGGLGPFHRPGTPQITSRAPHAPHGSRVPRVREERRGCGCEKWRSGRIVPLHTRRPFRGNRGIMRKPPDAPGASARTILPQRQNRNSMGSKSAPGPADTDRPARDRDRSARDRGPAAQGRPGRSRKTRREPIRPSMRTRTPPRPRPIPRRGARGACRGGAGEVI